MFQLCSHEDELAICNQRFYKVAKVRNVTIPLCLGDRFPYGVLVIYFYTVIMLSFYIFAEVFDLPPGKNGRQDGAILDIDHKCILFIFAGYENIFHFGQLRNNS